MSRSQDPEAALRALFDDGLEALDGGHLRKGLKLLEKAWEQGRALPGGTSLLPAVGRALIEGWVEGGKRAEIRRRGGELFEEGVRHPTLLETLLEVWVFEESRRDPPALDVAVATVETGAPLDEERRRLLLRYLSAALHVDLGDEAETVRARVPFLERLHRARPQLVFPLLHLGRYHYVARDFARARDLLGRIGGHLSETPRLLNLRGRCAEKTDDLPGALALYRTSLEHDHHQPLVHYRIGRILLHDYLLARTDA